MVPEDENFHEEEPDHSKAKDGKHFNEMFTQEEQLLQEHFGDVSRISTILDGNSMQEDTGNKSDQAEIADEDLIEQLLKDDNDIFDDTTETSSLRTDFDFDISTSSVNEPIEVKIFEETIGKPSNTQRKRKLKERWVLSERSQRRKSARLSLSTKPNYTLITGKSPNSVKEVLSEKMRRASCQKCEECLRDDCLQCVYCKDKKKYGGPNKLKQKCIEKRCSNKT